MHVWFKIYHILNPFLKIKEQSLIAFGQEVLFKLSFPGKILTRWRARGLEVQVASSGKASYMPGGPGKRVLPHSGSLKQNSF